MSTSSTSDHVAHLLPGFVAATLPADERRQVLTHLGTCAAVSGRTGRLARHRPRGAGGLTRAS